MATIKGSAPAKINLTLHVTGQRTDGYHQLDSLVVFAEVFDQITATSAPNLQVVVNGPFAQGIPTDHTNLVMRAATADSIIPSASSMLMPRSTIEYPR